MNLKIKIQVPNSWNDVTIEQFQEINSIQDNPSRSLEIISILIDKDIEEIRKYDMQSLNRIVDALKWCDELPKEEHTTSFEINGVKYNLVQMSSFSVGEWSDLEGYFEDAIGNLHKILGVFYRDNNLPYDTKTAEERAELFRKKVTVGQTYGSVVFFCNIERNCMRTIAVYFQLQTMKIQMENQKPNQKKRLGWLKRLRLKNGDGTRTFTV